MLHVNPLPSRKNINKLFNLSFAADVIGALRVKQFVSLLYFTGIIANIAWPL